MRSSIAIRPCFEVLHLTISFKYAYDATATLRFHGVVENIRMPVEEARTHLCKKAERSWRLNEVSMSEATAMSVGCIW